MLLIELLLLLLVANGAPILARFLLKKRWAVPIDAGHAAWDGHPWFGPSKTLHGAVAAVIASALTAWALGYTPGLGAAFGALAMAGDLMSSFIKRRLGIAPSGMALGLDQIPEALLPLLILREQFALAWLEVAELVALFFISELLLSRILYHMRIRERPY